MPTLQISFDVKLNPSVQVNDTAWISQEMPGNTLSEPTKLGEIVGVQGNILTVQVDTIVNYLGYIEGFFLLFSKPIHINESGLKDIMQTLPLEIHPHRTRSYLLLAQKQLSVVNKAQKV